MRSLVPAKSVHSKAPGSQSVWCACGVPAFLCSVTGSAADYCTAMPANISVIVLLGNGANGVGVTVVEFEMPVENTAVFASFGNPCSARRSLLSETIAVGCGVRTLSKFDLLILDIV